MKERWRDRLGAYDECELIRRINEAKIKRIDEFELVQEKGSSIIIRISNTDPEGITGNNG